MHNRVDVVQTCYNLDLGPSKHDEDRVGSVQVVYMKWFTEFGHLNRGDMLTSEQHRCHNEKKKFQRRV